jgi:hypothetical protein
MILTKWNSHEDHQTERAWSFGGNASHTQNCLGPEAGAPIEHGPFQASRESLKSCGVPDWFRDAKFGIWALGSAIRARTERLVRAQYVH